MIINLPSIVKPVPTKKKCIMKPNNIKIPPSQKKKKKMNPVNYIMKYKLTDMLLIRNV